MSGARTKQLVVLASALCCFFASKIGRAAPLIHHWPGEFAAIAKVLRNSKRTIEDRRAALFRMSEMEDLRLAQHLQFALSHRDPGLRQAGLEICATYEILTCIPQAKSILNNNPTPLAKVASLNVIALAPDRLAIKSLTSALSDSTDLIRSHAALLIGDTYWPKPFLKTVRYALMIKLADPSARVRRKLAEALGKLGPDSNSPVALALSPLLEDPDPEVRFITAHSLGQLQDPRTIPALLRSIEGDPDKDQAKIALTALAKIDDSTVDEILREILHRSGFRIDLEQRILAIGARNNPQQLLLEDIARNLTVPGIDDEDLKEAIFKVLLIHGQKGLAALRSVENDGLSASVQIKAQHIMAARPVQLQSQQVFAEQRPPSLFISIALRRMNNPLYQLTETSRLAKTWPSWLDPVLQASIVLSHSPVALAPWLSLSKHLKNPRLRLNRRASLRLFQFANDPNLSLETRCEAIRTLALKAVTNRRMRKQRSNWMTYFTQSYDFGIRRCSSQAMTVLSKGQAIAEFRGNPPTGIARSGFW